ncbi:MAG: DUF4249 domain-containing protein [Chitinophagaceae bacterium]
MTAPNRYLVVEGVINATPGGRTTIMLSRTRNLTDTFVVDPVQGAILQIEASNGTQYTLTEQAGGKYVSAPLSLNAGLNYRLKITTGSQYVSDFVPVKITPPIDSLSWTQDKDVTVFVSTHDPLNNARYYRWDFTETWQYEAVYDNLLGVENRLIFYKDSNTQTFNCWSEEEAREIALGTSVKLSQDVIDRAPVTIVPQNSEKISVRYSILVRQYTLTEEAHKYWEILQKNTQRLGSLFDAQPGQLKANIRNSANAAEPVIGFASASTVTEKRMFIDHAEVVDWGSLVPGPECKPVFTFQNPTNFLIYDYPDTSYVPYYFVTGGGLAVVQKPCIDCRTRGGINKKPSFW